MDVSTLVATIAYMGKEMNPGDGVEGPKNGPSTPSPGFIFFFQTTVVCSDST